jgi:hypothetical protein
LRGLFYVVVFMVEVFEKVGFLQLMVTIVTKAMPVLGCVGIGVFRLFRLLRYWGGVFFIPVFSPRFPIVLGGFSMSLGDLVLYIFCGVVFLLYYGKNLFLFLKRLIKR